MITTIMVFVMVALASMFFFAADQIIRYPRHLLARHPLMQAPELNP